jgi:two-component system sensor histidine kinase KdpD
VKKISLYKISNRNQSILSAAIVVLTASVCYLFSDYFGYRNVALILLFVVSILATFMNVFPLLMAAILSALIWDYFFIPPKFTFHVESAEDILMLGMYFVVALVNAILTNRIRKAEKEANEKEEKEKIIKLYNTLLNSLSHELRTPIATIIGATDTLQENEEKLDMASKKILVSEISTASLRLNQQVENLLNMSRLESGFLQLHKDWCDVNELVYKVVNEVQANTTNRQFDIQIIESLPYFKLDFGIMEQILYNLLINAVAYTPADTAIHIKVTRFDSDEISLMEPDNAKTKLVIVIRDEGKGFPEEEITKVFDKFYRIYTHKTGGTGLGLSIVKGFIEAHGGAIRLKNSSAGGAEFTIVIPTETNYMNALKNE